MVDDPLASLWAQLNHVLLDSLILWVRTRWEALLCFCFSEDHMKWLGTKWLLHKGIAIVHVCVLCIKKEKMGVANVFC
jgi:hypothetical protein